MKALSGREREISGEQQTKDILKAKELLEKLR